MARNDFSNDTQIVAIEHGAQRGKDADQKLGDVSGWMGIDREWLTWYTLGGRAMIDDGFQRGSCT